MPSEGAAPSFALTPSLARRMACMAYESLLLLAILLILLILPQTLFSAVTGILSPPAALWAHALLLFAAYFGWFWSKGRQTPAMKTWKIALLTESGAALNTGRALHRLMLSWLCLLPAGVGILWALIDRDGQFLHDRLAGTRLLLNVAQPTRSSRPPLP